MHEAQKRGTFLTNLNREEAVGAEQRRHALMTVNEEEEEEEEIDFWDARNEQRLSHVNALFARGPKIL